MTGTIAYCNTMSAGSQIGHRNLRVQLRTTFYGRAHISQHLINYFDWHRPGRPSLTRCTSLASGKLGAQIVLSALVALNFSDFPAGVESGEGLDAARTKFRRMPPVAAIAVAVNYASAHHRAQIFRARPELFKKSCVDTALK